MPDVTPDTNADAGAILEGIRESIHRDEHRYTVHAQTQMAARHITSAEIVETLLSDAAEVIEEYPDDKYSPSCLICGVAGSGRVLHIQSNHKAVIITAYEPDPEKWVDAKRRKGSP